MIWNLSIEYCTRPQVRRTEEASNFLLEGMVCDAFALGSVPTEVEDVSASMLGILNSKEYVSV